MYRVIQGSKPGLNEVAPFIELMNTLDRCVVPEAQSLFDQDREVFVARAPGRLDVMGGIADYSGSLVLQLPLQLATCAALQRLPERKLRVVSLGSETGARSLFFEMPLIDFEKDGTPIDYASAQAYFKRNAATQWAGYVAGAFLALMREQGVIFKNGACVLLHSDVPEGKGVSSSAALEVAVMAAVVSAFKITMNPLDLAKLCQKVENLIVGAPCGVMDQATAACGQAQQLLALLCQPAVLQEPVRIPDHLSFWGIDSGVRHSVSGADYTSVRVGAFMGYRIVAERAGCKILPGKKEHHVSIEDKTWHGFLANLPPSVFQREHAPHLPETIKGSAFLERYHGTTDEVTVINPDAVYRVAQPTAHPIYEHFRVRTFAELLQNPQNQRALEQLGELMYQSHGSYSACGLGSPGTDRLVELARASGPARGIYGAKITGGGSGGTVAILGRADAFPAVVEICARYAEETNYRPQIFSGSSMGAAEFGCLVLRST